MDTAFFAYGSSREATRETLFTAGRKIESTGLIKSRSWEELKVGGKVVIRQIFQAIDEASLAVFDVSTLNENVLFEMGYAIARGKRIWILLDKTDREVTKRWAQFRLLYTVGYQTWANSEDIKVAFLRDRPDIDDGTNLYDELIEPNLTPEIEGALFYLPSFHSTEAAMRLGQRLDRETRRGIRLISADPTESAVSPIAWYAQKAFETSGTIAHLVAHRRDHAWLHNARISLVAGMAVGLERPLLLLSEEDYTEPFDYRDLLHRYDSPSNCVEQASSWLASLDLPAQTKPGGRRLRLVTELRGLRFGEPVAENESDVLSDYFVETGAFDDVMRSRNTLFIGRKGSGKTANMLQAAARLREDARNLVVVVKPQSYELEGLASLLSSLPMSAKPYAVVSLWNFLLQSEIARSAVLTLKNRLTGVPFTDAERRLLAFIDDSDFGIMDDFAIRFERTIGSIQQFKLADVKSIADGRDVLNEALHAEAIRTLRGLLGPVLKGRNRVAVLVDNLDKAWDRRSDLDVVSQLLLGLLSAVGQVETEYGKEDYWRDRVSLTLAIFLRSDIYSHIQRDAREPDKIPTSLLTWEDPELLLRVIEERFLAARPTKTSPDELWDAFLCETVTDMPIRDYLSWRVLPRPRDMIYLLNAAIISAVNSRRVRVEEHDFVLAARYYSQFALEALLVENGITISELEDILLEFAAEPPIRERSDVLDLISRTISDRERATEVLMRLQAMSFLGVEVGPGRFIYPEMGPAGKLAETLAGKLAESRGGVIRHIVHPAYRPYLEIPDTELGDASPST